MTTIVESILEHANPLLTVTIKMFVSLLIEPFERATVGLAIVESDSPFAVFQLYVYPPIGRDPIVSVDSEQRYLSSPASTMGSGNTITVTESEVLQLSTVVVTIYIRVSVIVSLFVQATVGLATVESDRPFAVFQEY